MNSHFWSLFSQMLNIILVSFCAENGIHMFLWVGLNVSNDWVMNVFGVSSVMQIDTDKASLPYLENPLSARIRELIKSIRSQRNRAMRVSKC